MTVAWADLAATLGAHPFNLDVQVFNGTQTNSDQLLYDSRAARHGSSYTARFTEAAPIYLFGHPWTLVYRTLPAFKLDASAEHAPQIIMVAGGTAYVLGLVTLHFAKIYREQAMELARRLRHARKVLK